MKCLVPGIFLALAISFTALPSFAEEDIEAPPKKHPDTSRWDKLYEDDLSNMTCNKKKVWSIKDGVLSATEDRNLWTRKDYDNFILDLEFKTADKTNSGVHLYFSKPGAKDWFNYCVEVQITDDHSDHWSSKPKEWQCGAIFGHQGAKKSAVKKPGEWNRYTITCIDKKIYVMLNGEMVNEFDMSKWTDAEKTPDGKKIPRWLTKKAMAELPTKGRIGFQGKHAGAPVYFRNMRIKEIKNTKDKQGE